MKSKTEWLKEMPPSEEITEINGIMVLLSHVVKEKLDELTNSGWETQKYQSKFFKIQGNDYISASLELNVMYDEKTYRTLVGAVTFPLDYFPENLHWDNTAKTLCIVNAASDLGNQFGRSFNKIGAVVTSGIGIKKESQKMKPDFEVLKMYSDAIVAGNTEKIKHLQEIYDLNQTDETNA